MKDGNRGANDARGAGPDNQSTNKTESQTEAVNAAVPSARAEAAIASAPVDVPAPASETIVALAGVYKLGEAGKLHDDLKRALAGPPRVVLDAREVRGADTSALQLLDAFMREALARRFVVEWRQPSGTMLRDAMTLGLTEKLQLPS
jgi:MFS superfamily sulfate permease-like transporter